MVEWLKQLVIGDGNVVRERAYTNWNKLDVGAIVAEKQKQDASVSPSSSHSEPAEPKQDSGAKK